MSVFLSVLAALCTFGLIRVLARAIASVIAKAVLRRSPYWRRRVEASIREDRQFDVREWQRQWSDWLEKHRT